METYNTDEYQYVFDDIEFVQYIQSHDNTLPIVIGDIIANEGSEKQQNSGNIKYNQTPEKSKNEQHSNIETNHQLGFHSVLDCLHDQVCTALRDDVSDNCGIPIRHQASRKNIRMGSESTFFENSEDAHRSENTIQCTADKMGKSVILSDKQDDPPHLLSNVADNQNGEIRKPTLVHGTETGDANTDNRTPILQVQTQERLYQGGNNTVKRKESKTNTVINNLFNCGDVQNAGTSGKQSTGSVNTEGSEHNPQALFKNNESPIMKRPYHDTGGTRNSSKKKIQCTKRPKINPRINHKKYFEKNNIYFMEIWKYNMSLRTLACGEFKCNDKYISKNLVDITDQLVDGFMSAHETFVQQASGVAKFENQDTISSGSLQELCSKFIVKLVIFTVEFSECIRPFLPSGEDEKKIQIKACLLEIAVIYYVYWRLVRKSDMFLEVYGLNPEKCKFQNMGQIGILLDNLLYTTAALNLLELKKEELVLLAAMILLSPDRHGSTKESNTQLKKLEEVMCVALKYNMLLLHPVSPPCLFERTIRTLIDIRMLSELHLENFLQSQIA